MEAKITWRENKIEPSYVGSFLVCGYQILNTRMVKRIDIAYWSPQDKEWTFESSVPMTVDFWAELPDLPLR